MTRDGLIAIETRRNGPDPDAERTIDRLVCELWSAWADCAILLHALRRVDARGVWVDLPPTLRAAMKNAARDA